MAGFSLLLVLGYQYLLKMPYFYLKNTGDIKIEGQQRLTTEQIMQMGQVSPGISLLAINPLKIEKNLYQHPWIEKVEIKRAWPDHLIIRIQEHQPIAIVNLDSLYYLSRKGRLFQALNPGELHDLPVITGLKRDDFQLWEGNLPPLLTKFIGILESLNDNHAPLHLGNISEIHLDPERGLTLYPLGLKVGIDIGFQSYSEKFNILQKVLTALQQRGEIKRVEKINLTYPKRVLISYKSGEEASP
jgi:cell division protein FtsQ